MDMEKSLETLVKSFSRSPDESLHRLRGFVRLFGGLGFIVTSFLQHRCDVKTSSSSLFWVWKASLGIEFWSQFLVDSSGWLIVCIFVPPDFCCNRGQLEVHPVEENNLDELDLL